MAFIAGAGKAVPVDVMGKPVPDGTTVVFAGKGGWLVAFIGGFGNPVPIEGCGVVVFGPTGGKGMVVFKAGAVVVAFEVGEGSEVMFIDPIGTVGPGGWVVEFRPTGATVEGAVVDEFELENGIPETELGELTGVTDGVGVGRLMPLLGSGVGVGDGETGEVEVVVCGKIVAGGLLWELWELDAAGEVRAGLVVFE